MIFFVIMFKYQVKKIVLTINVKIFLIVCERGGNLFFNLSFGEECTSLSKNVISVASMSSRAETFDICRTFASVFNVSTKLRILRK